MNEQRPSISGRAVRERMEELAPPHLAESWDNVGWQVGHDGAVITGILVTLDADLTVVEEAVRQGANLIVAHHPTLFHPLKRINPADPMGRLLRRLLCEEIHLFAAHTNLDAVRGGVNDALADALGLVPDAPLQHVPGAPHEWGFGAICDAHPPLTTGEMVRRVASLGCPAPRVTVGWDAPTTHHRIALLGGSGASMIEDAIAADCTLFITGEVKYHEAQEAARRGLTLIEADHFYSERPVLERLVAHLLPLGVPVSLSTQITTPFTYSWEHPQ